MLVILDSILDDYYLLWECFEDYKQYIKSDDDYKIRFLEALKEAYEKKYFNFFMGQNFDGDEVLIPKFEISNSIIDELLNYENNPTKEIRITTSNLGIEFLERFWKDRR